jgi:hypothetical protein
MEMFSRAHETMARSWEQMLTKSISPESFSRAFIDADTRYADAAAANARGDTRGLLVYAMEKEFAALARDAPRVIPCLVTDVVRNWMALTREEFGEVVAGAGVAARFADLEKKELELRAAAAAATAAGSAAAAADRPAPLPLMPDDEMRSVAVEAKLAYEAKLTSELELVRAGP